MHAPTTAASIALALAPCTFAAVTTVTAEREISVFSSATPSGPALDLEGLGLFDDSVTATPGASTASAQQTSTVLAENGLLEAVFSAFTSTSIIEEDAGAVNADARSTLSIRFELTTEAMWTLDGTVSRVGANTGNARFQLVGPDTLSEFPFFLEPVVDGGEAALNASGLLGPGEYVLSFTIGGLSSSTRDPGATDVAADLTFSIVPAPSALALLTIAPLVTRRRR